MAALGRRHRRARGPVHGVAARRDAGVRDALRRAILIVNPFASGVTEERIGAVASVLGRVAEVDVQLTSHPRHATELATAACASGGCAAIFVLSGDGGFNEAVNGSDGNVPLGFVPGGGTSVLPRALGLPRDPIEAAERLAAALAAGRTRRISLGRVNGRRFTFSAGLGFAAEAVRRVEQGRGEDGRRPSDLRFALTIARMLLEHGGRFEPVLELEGVGRAAFLFVSNGDPYTYAQNVPLHLTPAVTFEGGLDFAAPVRFRPRDVVPLFAYTVRGRGRLRNFLHGHDLDRIAVRCDAPMPLQADGEDLCDVERAVFEVEREALSVLI